MTKKIDKQKMATIGEIHSRIVWDSNLNRNTFIAGFHERVSAEIREKPLVQWHDNSDIPWHRIRYIRCGETVVWDRDLRIDLFSSNNLPAMAWKSIDEGEEDRTDTAALVANNRGDFQGKDIYKWQNDRWQISDGTVKSFALDRPLKVITYNILSDLHEVDKIYSDLRWELLLAELDRVDADIIALQEVTPTSLAVILAADWVRSSYYISASPAADNVKPYGNVLLSRWHFDLVEHQFSAHKRVLVGSWQINDRAVHLANIHLTSSRGENSLQKRDLQLATVVNYLQTLTGDRFIVGDFNARDNQLAEIIDYGNFRDLWCDTHPDDVGHTIEPNRNPLAMLMTLEGMPARFDRILWKSDRDRSNGVKSIDLLGSQPMIIDGIECFPSDHFGLCARIDLSDKKLAYLEPNLNLDLTTIDPVYESILAIIPPLEILPAIQAIRHQFDRGFIRILPHITLLYGFLPDRYFDRAVDKIAPILARLQPFSVSLTEFDVFTHHQTATAWLRPVVTPESALHELQDTLYRLFPQCYEQSTKTAAGFNPHVSVGQFANPAEAMAKLPQWHPVKFTVDRVALLSRRREESCVIRQVIGIGKQLPKVANSYELEELIFAIEPELTTEDRSRQQIGLDLITQACTTALGFGAIVHRLGSARLGIGSAKSDLDLVCAIPNYVSGAEFLERTAELLDGLADRIQVISTAKFPVLRLELEGVSFDLLYTQVPIDRLDLINNITTAGKVENISNLLPTTDKDPPSIAGCWEADIILDRVGAHLPISCFRTLLTAVRAWAKVRGIYGNSFMGIYRWLLVVVIMRPYLHRISRSRPFPRGSTHPLFRGNEPTGFKSSYRPYR
jgi:poly(A) polymerase